MENFIDVISGRPILKSCIFPFLFASCTGTQVIAQNSPYNEDAATCIKQGHATGSLDHYKCKSHLEQQRQWRLEKQVENETQANQKTQQYSEPQSNYDDVDDATCKKYGFQLGTSGYLDCRIKIDQVRQRSYAQNQPHLQDEGRRANEQTERENYREEIAREKKQRSADDNLRLIEQGLKMMQGPSRNSSVECTSIPIGGGQTHTTCR